MEAAHRTLPAHLTPAQGGGGAARSVAVWSPASVPHAPVCPLWARLFDALPLSAVASGAVVAGALALAFFVLDLIDGNVSSLLRGEVSPWRHVEVRSAINVAILLAGVVVTHRYEERGTRRDVERLAPLLRDAAHAAGLSRPVSPSAPGLRAAGLLGAILIACIVPTLYQDPSRFLRVETYRLPSVLFDLLVGAVLGWTTFKTLFASLDQDRRFARLAAHVRSIDLLDLSPLHVFGRRGLRRALRWLLLVSVAALVFVDAGTAVPPAVVLTGIFGFATISFLFPVWGAHRTILAAKREELYTLRALIAKERKALRESGWRPAEAGGRFADLLTYEGRVSAASTWPFDASTLARLSLYACLPLGSWLASAVVSHIVEVWLQ